MTETDRAAYDAAIKELEGEFAQLIGHIRRRHLEAAQEVSPGMLSGSYKVFALIAKRGPVTSSDLTDILVLDKGQMSRTVKDLEERGLIARTPDPNDKRASLLDLTSLGRERLSAARLPHHRSLGEALHAFSPDDITRTAQLMRALYDYADSTRTP